MSTSVRIRLAAILLSVGVADALAGERQGGITAVELQRAAPQVKSAVALKTLKALGKAYSTVHDLDIDLATRAMKPQAAKSVRSAWLQIKALKDRGAFVSYERADWISPEMVVRLDQPLEAREKATLQRIAYTDLVRLDAGPKLRTLAMSRLSREKGLRKSSSSIEGLAVREADGRIARAARVILSTDDRLDDRSRVALVKLIGEHGDTNDIALLKQLDGKDVGAAAKQAIGDIEQASNMTVAFATWEAKPYAVTGGLGNVMQELPTALAKMGHRPVVVLPRHQKIDRNKLQDTGVTVWVDEPNAPREPVKVLYEKRDGVVFLFAENGKYLSDGRHGLYTDADGHDYGDTPERYDFFGAAVPKILREVAAKRPDLVEEIPDIVQLNDAHTASAAHALNQDEAFSRSGTVFAVHNLGKDYQGRFDVSHLPNMRFKDEYYPAAGQTFGKAESYGMINFAKYGIEASDEAIPVSPNYAMETTGPRFGDGLQGVTSNKKAAGRYHGNLNGIDGEVWDPSNDALVPHKYDLPNLAGKAKNKEELQKLFSLPKSDRPVIAVVARVTAQKGFDDVIKAVESSIRKGQKVQYAVMGNGDPHMIWQLQQLAAAHPEMVKYLPYSAENEHLMYAGSDMFLMPSKFEPSGLPQMYSLRYLTVPIVRRVGGLVDSVKQYDRKAGTGNGFTFGDDVEGAVADALAWYHSGDRGGLLRNAALSDFDWRTTSAPEQLAIYRRVLNRKRR